MEPSEKAGRKEKAERLKKQNLESWPQDILVVKSNIRSFAFEQLHTHANIYLHDSMTSTRG